MSIANYNGSFIAHNEATHAIDKNSLEEKVFTTILVEDGFIFFLEKHLRRLQQHVRQLGIFRKIDSKILFQLVEKNNALNGRWRIRVILGKNTFLATLQKEASQLKKIKLVVYPTPIVSKHANLKISPDPIREKLLLFSKQKGYDDCIKLDRNQNILETAIANIFWIKANTLYYPDPKLPYLFGITLSSLIDIARNMNMSICPGNFKLSHLDGACVFYCNSIKKVIAVDAIEGFSIQKSTEKQQEHFLKALQDYAYSELKKISCSICDHVCKCVCRLD